MTPSKVTWKPRALAASTSKAAPKTTSSDDTGDVVMSSFTPAVEPNLTQSVKWLKKAANQGHADAKRLLETVLATAKGVR